MESKRIYLYDNLKFLLIVFVVAGHFIDYGELTSHDACFRSIFTFIYSFHMPLFIFVGGLFYKAKNIGSKVFSYLATGAALIIALFIKDLIIYGKLTISFINITGTPWFMFALAAFTALSYVFRKVNKKLLLTFSVVFACFAGYCLQISDGFALSRIIVFYPFFVAGTMTDKFRLEALVKKKGIKLSGAVIIAVWLWLCFNFTGDMYLLRGMFTGRNPFPLFKYPFSDFGGLYRLLCYAISAVVGFGVISICLTRRIPVISEVGKRTLQIYFWHAPIIYFILIIPAIQEMIEANTYTCWGFLLMSVVLTFILALKPFAYPEKLFFDYAKNNK